MKFIDFLNKRTDFYAYFHGAVGAQVGETCNACFKIKHNGDYQAMYEDLRSRIKECCAELDAKLEATK